MTQHRVTEARARVRLPSGRQVGVHTLATVRRERTVVLCHPAPGSGAFDPDPEATAARAKVLPDAGHLVVVPGWARALAHLAPRRAVVEAFV